MLFRSEQLFEKKSEGWWYWLNKNLFDLTFYASDKALKAIWFSDETFQKKLNYSLLHASMLENILSNMDYEPMYRIISSCYSTIAGNCRSENGNKSAVEYYRYYLVYAKKYDEFVSSDRTFANLPMKAKQELTGEWNTSKIHNQVKVAFLWLENTPWLEELRQDEDFRALLEIGRASCRARV